MLYCQRCGAENVEDARFCNMCGAAIAQVGEPGGPTEEAPEEPSATLHGHREPLVDAIVAKPAPAESPPPKEPEAPEPRAPGREKKAAAPADSDERDPTPAPRSPYGSDGFDVSTISLSAIGVRSPVKAWGTIVLVVLLLVGLGAGGMWLLMNGDEGGARVADGEETVPGEPSGPDDEIEIGDVVPEGTEEPDVDFVPGTPRPSTPTKSTPRRPRASAGASGQSGASGSSGSSGSTGSSGAGGSTGGSTAGAGGTGTPGGTGGTGGSAGEPGGAGGEAGGEAGEPGGAGGTSGGTTDEPDWETLEEEGDVEMDLYAARLRSFIRTYYSQRAANCFSHESRNQQVRGTVVIGFQIQQDGTVRSTSVDRNTTGIDTLGRCLTTQVGSWRLPPPPEGEAPLAMQMPFSR